jgi:hypothetical protein
MGRTEKSLFIGLTIFVLVSFANESNERLQARLRVKGEIQ